VKPRRKCPSTNELLAASMITKIAAGPLLDKVLSRCREGRVALCRGIAMYVIYREIDDISMPIIAKMFHLKNHTAVFHWCNRIENETRLHALAIIVQREFEQMKPIFEKDKIYDKFVEGLHI
jgi:chromosomal replication initiation ATPase DnaA